MFIRRSRELGFTIADIRELLAIIDGDQISCQQVKEIADRHVAVVRAKIDDLARIEKTLARLSAACIAGDVPECPIIDALLRGRDPE